MRSWLVASVAVVLVVAAACSGGQESPRAERSGRAWVTAVCTDLRLWLRAAHDRPGPAAVEKASRQLEADIRALVPPKTDDGGSAQGEVERLAQAIRQRAGTRSTAALVAEVRASVDGIRNLTPGGAIERAFRAAPQCRAVRG